MNSTPIIEIQPAAHGNIVAASVARKMPLPVQRYGPGGEANTFVIRQFGRLHRRSRILEIRRRSTHNQTVIVQRASDHEQIFVEWPDAHNRLVAALYRVDERIGQHEIDLDFREVADKARDNRHQSISTECDGGADAHATAGNGIEFLRECIACGYVGEYRATAFKAHRVLQGFAGACFGSADACRAFVPMNERASRPFAARCPAFPMPL